MRAWSQSNTSCSTQPTRARGPFPSRTRLGNDPAFSNRWTCAELYRTNSFSCFFDSNLITSTPEWEPHEAQVEAWAIYYRSEFDRTSQQAFARHGRRGRLRLLKIGLRPHTGLPYAPEPFF